MIVSRHAHGEVDILILDGILQHHACAHLTDMGALNFLPRRL